MSHAGMSPSFAVANEIDPGRYQAHLEFPMAGDWVILLHVTLPGGQPASELLYTGARVDYAVFEYDACNQRIGVTLTLSTNDIGLLNEFEDVLPESAYPICDGPDFSDRDRADTSVPLRS